MRLADADADATARAAERTRVGTRAKPPPGLLDEAMTSTVTQFPQQRSTPADIEPTTPGASVDRRSWLMRFFAGRTLDQCIESGRDNLLLLRLVAALMVVLGHSVMGGFGTLPFEPLRALVPRANVHEAGLMVFFLISGLLITLSYERRPDLLRFVRARVLRLWPGLLFCLVAWTFVLGPLLSTSSPRDYFSFAHGDSPYRFLLDNALLIHSINTLPGLFYASHTVAPGMVDSPLWSLWLEVRMYLCVAGAGVLRLLRFRWLLSVALVAVFAWLLVIPMLHAVPPRYGYVVMGFFAAGAIACLLRRHIPISNGIMLLVLVVFSFGRHTTHATPVMWLTLAYAALWFAYVPRLPGPPLQADLSYATYLWSWPIQQTVVQLTGAHEPLLVFALTIAVALPIAAVSWFFIEKPALRLKDHPWLQGWRPRRFAGDVSAHA